ncbi:nucleoside phosphorylase domain-containing protein [Xylaria scruposa]|nr:nucleoside phosphorylase domain-containing protein [Xylaria scruposa]
MYGSLGPFGVVIPVTNPGNIASAQVANLLPRVLKNLKVIIVGGICGAIPAISGGRRINLGDVIIADKVVETTRKQYKKDFCAHDQIQLLPPSRTRQSYNENLGRDIDFYEEKIRLTMEQLKAKEEIAKLSIGGQQTSVGIHIGTMATGNEVIKDGGHRDEIAKKYRAIAFDMEAGGAWDGFMGKECFVVKGVSDHADSAKNDDQHKWASFTSIAAIKTFLENGYFHIEGPKWTTANPTISLACDGREVGRGSISRPWQSATAQPGIFSETVEHLPESTDAIKVKKNLLVRLREWMSDGSNCGLQLWGEDPMQEYVREPDRLLSKLAKRLSHSNDRSIIFIEASPDRPFKDIGPAAVLIASFARCLHACCGNDRALMDKRVSDKELSIKELPQMISQLEPPAEGYIWLFIDGRSISSWPEEEQKQAVEFFKLIFGCRLLKVGLRTRRFCDLRPTLQDSCSFDITQGGVKRVNMRELDVNNFVASLTHSETKVSTTTP